MMHSQCIVRQCCHTALLLPLSGTHFPSSQEYKSELARGGVKPWWMARWKARAEFLLSVIELLFLSLTVEALQGKMCQNSLPSGVGRSLGAKISGGRGRPWGIFFGFYTFCNPTVQTARCYVPSFWHNTGVWRTDRRTDRETNGIAVAITALAMRALRRAVKIISLLFYSTCKLNMPFPVVFF